MNRNMQFIGVFLAGLVTCTASLSTTVFAADDGHPVVTRSLPFFYYNDLPAAADWYRNKLGLKPLTEEDWVVIFELNESSCIGLVKAGSGLLKPTEDKGAIFSIDTPELEAWWDRLKDMEGINIKNGIRTGADGMIESFSVYDPEGYIVEFFRWKEHRPEAQRYLK